MKKFLAAVGLMAGFTMLAGKAMAAITDTIVLSVTPNVNKSVSIDVAAYNFGTQNLGATNLLSSSATVTNDGDFISSWSLQITTPDPVWTAAAAAAADASRLSAIFNDSVTPPVAANFTDGNDDVTTTESFASGANHSGNQTGTGVAAGATRGLWFLLDMPTSTSVSGARSFTMTIEVQ